MTASPEATGRRLGRAVRAGLDAATEGRRRRAAARALLGVPAGADVASIEAAWRRAMRRGHPDAGGSEDEAARITAARDLLVAALRG